MCWNIGIEMIDLVDDGRELLVEQGWGEIDGRKYKQFEGIHSKYEV